MTQSKRKRKTRTMYQIVAVQDGTFDPKTYSNDGLGVVSPYLFPSKDVAIEEARTRILNRPEYTLYVTPVKLTIV